MAASKQREESEKALVAARSGQAEKPKPDEKPSPRHEPGAIVESFTGEVHLRGEHVLTAKGLAPGQTYLFRASGSCQRSGRRFRVGAMRVARQDRTDIDGIDFRVQLGSQDSRSLSLGQEGRAEENRLEFVADAPKMTIRVFDASTVGRDVECTLGSFAVVAQ